MRTCGEVLVTMLQNYGIDTVFGIPGVHTIELYRGLPGTGIRHVTPRHEQGAGFMADGYARATGRPAACFIITGPGMTNIMTAMGQALADSVPMLVISSASRTHELGHGQGRLHEMRHQGATVAGVARFSHTLLRPDELLDVVARAFSVFDGARPGPVHIEIPIDVITAPADHVSLERMARLRRPGPNPASIADAADLLKGARDPIVVLGGGTQDHADAARALVERLGARTVLTVNGKGVLPSGHPLSVGARLAQAPVRQAVENADVVLAIGTELGETDTLLFDGRLDIRGKVIRVDADVHQLTANVRPAVAILSDAGLAMDALLHTLDGFGGFNAGSAAAALVAEGDASMPTRYAGHGLFLGRLEKAMPGMIVAGDSTQPVYGGNMFFDPDAPRRFFNSTTGFGTLGYAIPAAIGAKLARPDASVVAVVGDGGAQFSIAELGSAVEADVPVIVVIWNNRGYREIKDWMVRAGIAAIGVDIFTPAFDHLAQGFGCDYFRVESAADLDAALEGANALARSRVIEVIEDRYEMDRT